MVVCQGLEGGKNGEMLVTRYKVSVIQDEWVLETLMCSLVAIANNTVLYTWNLPTLKHSYHKSKQQQKMVTT